jgi:hypothetical protein
MPFPPGGTAHHNVAMMDGLESTARDYKNGQIHQTNCLINKNDLSKTNLPAYYTILNNQQTGQILAYMKNRPNTLQARDFIAKKYQSRFNSNGYPMTVSQVKKNEVPNWGPPCDDPDVAEEDRKRLGGDPDNRDAPPGWDARGVVSTYQYMGQAMP